MSTCVRACWHTPAGRCPSCRGAAAPSPFWCWFLGSKSLMRGRVVDVNSVVHTAGAQSKARMCVRWRWRWRNVRMLFVLPRNKTDDERTRRGGLPSLPVPCSPAHGLLLKVKLQTLLPGYYPRTGTVRGLSCSAINRPKISPVGWKLSPHQARTCAVTTTE